MNSDVIVNQERSIKKDTSRLCFGILIYTIIMSVGMIVSVICRMIALLDSGDVKNSGAAFAEIESSLTNSGVEYIVVIIIGMLFFAFFFRKLGLKNIILKENKKIEPKNFIELLFVFMSAQCMFSICGFAIENGLNSLGFSVLGDLEAASAYSTTISMFLYASILGPISEELIFRGFVLRGLEKYGEKLAIVVSAVLFGAFHGNFVQGLFASVVGLVLGYVAMRYSIKWSIALHIINNCLFGDVLGHLTSGFSDTAQDVIWYIIQGIFLIGAIVVIFKNRNSIKKYIRENRCKGYKQVFSSVGMIIFLVAMFMTAMLGVEKI